MFDNKFYPNVSKQKAFLDSHFLQRIWFKLMSVLTLSCLVFAPYIVNSLLESTYWFVSTICVPCIPCILCIPCIPSNLCNSYTPCNPSSPCIPYTPFNSCIICIQNQEIISPHRNIFLPPRYLFLLFAYSLSSCWSTLVLLQQNSCSQMNSPSLQFWHQNSCE